jgi:hypothetical protein
MFKTVSLYIIIIDYDNEVITWHKHPAKGNRPAHGGFSAPYGRFKSHLTRARHYYLLC